MSGRIPTVSVVMPAHNVRPFLRESVRSVLDQSFTDFELVILENGSTDGTAAVCAEVAGWDERIRCLSRPGRMGNGAASNAAVAEAQARLIARVDADDSVAPRWLERLMGELEHNADAVLVGTLFVGMDPDGRSVRPIDRSVLVRPGFEAPFSHGGVLFRRGAYDAVGGYREDVEGWEDLDFFQRLASAGRMLVVPEALYRVRYHGTSMTAERDLDEMRRILADRHRTEAERFAGSAHTPARLEVLDELYLKAALRLWRRQRPGLLGAFASNRLLGEALRRPGLLAWGALGAVSPSALRRLVRALVAGRDRLAARKLAGRGTVEWRFG